MTDRMIWQDKAALTNLSWSPDGQQLLLLRSPDELLMIDREGKLRHQTGPGDNPAWVSNGTIVFEREHQVFFYDLAEERTRILRLRDASIASRPKRLPLPDPQGKHLLFLAQGIMISPQNIPRTRFALCHCDGSQARILEIEAHGGSYSWSPQGDLAACHSWDCRGGTIYLVDLAGELQAKLAGYHNPSFSPTGEYLACRTENGVRVFSRQDQWKNPIIEQDFTEADEQQGCNFNPVFWLDQKKLLLEAAQKLWQIELPKGHAKKIYTFATLPRRGIPVMALAPDGVLAYEQTAAQGSRIHLLKLAG